MCISRMIDYSVRNDKFNVLLEIGIGTIKAKSLQRFPKHIQWQRRREVCDRIYWKRLLNKLDRQRLKDRWFGQQAMISKRSGYAGRPQHETTDGIPQRGKAKPSGVDICTPGRPAWTRSASELSASAAVWGAALCGRISMRCDAMRAAAFITDCTRFISWDKIPVSVGLP